ncbi:MAG: putative cobalt-factor III C(17)-methyltransferase [Syntrophomonadaceae bacterium]|nr:putative cobalt-factor III C(17)-methyltransferase [Bacillota bacterium]
MLGYKTYLNLAAPMLEGKEVISSGMKQEVVRAELAVRLALEGKRVAVVSGGDPGVYGMAGPVLELAPAGLEVEVIPGITAANAAAALLGAPLMHDFACISLSDLLTPWETIERRLAAAAEADFIVVLYNPRSTGRAEHLEAARRAVLSRRASTVTGWVKNCGRADEQSRITTLAELDTAEVDMFTTVVVGNSQTFVQNGRMITPRGYKK